VIDFLVQIITRPVRDDRPAFDFFRKFKSFGSVLSYHFEVNNLILREALEVVDFLRKNKINYNWSKFAIGDAVVRESKFYKV